MKKALKIIGYIVGFLVLIILGFILFLQFKPIPVYDVSAPEFELEKDSLSIANGAKIAQMTCANCHLSKDKRLGGQAFGDSDGLGDIYAPNITNHPTRGVGKYTPGELALLLRTGIAREHYYVPPWMPKFPLLSDEDLSDIVAFLKSDHPLVQPSENEWPKSEYNFLAKALIKMKAFGPLEYPENRITAPTPTDAVAHGKYLATAVYDCFSCHSPDFQTANLEKPEETPGYFSGGNPIHDLEGEVVMSKNLTMDPETGLGKWTKEDFVKSVKYGLKPDGSGTNRYPMPPFSLLTDDEVENIWAYLQTIPVIKNENG